jgi:poly(3-hydroxybutyrate) depolymerase
MVRLKAAGVGIALLLFAVAVGPLLIVLARSRRGRVEGVFGVALSTFAVASSVWLAAPLFGAALPDAAGFVALAMLPLLFIRPATRRRLNQPAAGPVGSHALGVGPSPEPVPWADPEDDYVRVAVWLVTRLDPFMPAAEARATRAKTDELLTAVAALPDYAGVARIGGRMPWRLLRGDLDPRHGFSYRPAPRDPGERLGLFVFLHGHGSNYLFVVHALRPLCDRLRLCLVAPTFGYGNWEAAGGVGAVERATRFGLAAFDADPERVFLGGLSQGGAGVSRAGAAHPELFAGLIFISPTMEPDAIGSAAFRDGWTDRPVLVIQGQRDRNVHPRTVDGAVGLMEAAGVRVAQHRDPESGHFLLFAKLDAVTDVISSWAEAIPRRR